MAKFYGLVKGARGEASRLGGKKSGISTVAASWQGAVKTRLYEKTHSAQGVKLSTPQIWAEIRLTAWHGHGVEQLIYDGPVIGAADARVSDKPAGK